MAKDRLLITGTGMVTPWGEGPVSLERLASGGLPSLAEVEPGVTVPLASLGRLRQHPFRSRVERFSQLDALSQYAVVAAGHALDEAGLAAGGEPLQDYGTMLGTCFGTQESNWQFDRFSLDPADEREGVRPLIFKSTVDNVPAGWVAIGYRLRGVTTTFVSGPGAGAEALWAAAQAVTQGLAPGVVVCGGERLIPPQVAALHRDADGPSSFLAEGAAAVVLESAHAAEERGRTARGELTAWGLLPWSRPDRLVQWLEQQGLTPGEVSGASCVAATRGQLRAGRALLEGAGLRGPCWQDHLVTGDLVSGQALLAAGLLVARLEAQDRRAIALLAVKAEGDHGFCFLVSPGRR